MTDSINPFALRPHGLLPCSSLEESFDSIGVRGSESSNSANNKSRSASVAELVITGDRSATGSRQTLLAPERVQVGTGRASSASDSSDELSRVSLDFVLDDSDPDMIAAMVNYGLKSVPLRVSTAYPSSSPPPRSVDSDEDIALMAKFAVKSIPSSKASAACSSAPVSLEISVSGRDLGIAPKTLSFTSRLQNGLSAGLTLTPADSGSAAFLLKGPDGKVIAVVKPTIFESGASMYSKNRAENTKHGLKPREAAAGELLAYEYAKMFGTTFAVPPTVLGEVGSPSVPGLHETPSLASIQEFIPGCSSLHKLNDEEKGLLKLQQVQNLAILDIALVNADRHGANVLVDPSGNLVTIDNGLILPRNLENQAEFSAWLDLSQSKEPLTEDSRALIKVLTTSLLESVLEKFPSVGDFRTEEFKDRLATHTFALQLLKTGVEKGLTLYEIGRFLTNYRRGFIYESGNETIGSRIFDAWKRDGGQIKKLSSSIAVAMDAYCAQKTALEGRGLDLENVCTQALRKC